MKEDYLPDHMRIGFISRLIRFIFGPLCIISVMTIMTYYPEYKKTDTACFNRYK